MKKEIIDESTIYSDIFTDPVGRTWNLLQRTDGSVSLYTEHYGVHSVAWDSLDGTEPNLITRRIATQMRSIVEGMNLLLAAVDSQASAGEKADGG